MTLIPNRDKMPRLILAAIVAYFGFILGNSMALAYTQEGYASYYWQGQRVASGGKFNPHALTAAHKTLPFGSIVHVTNKHNGKQVTVTINDRGPFIKGRIIDLSLAAAKAISMTGRGVARVHISTSSSPGQKSYKAKSGKSKKYKKAPIPSSKCDFSAIISGMC